LTKSNDTKKEALLVNYLLGSSNYHIDVILNQG